MTAWCIIAYRYIGGMRIFGPYELRAIAATAAAMVESTDEFEAAYVIALAPPADAPGGA